MKNKVIMENPVTRNASEIINHMEPISLEEMDHVKLMQRKDSKYVLPAERVPSLIGEIKDSYRVLEVDNVRIQPYNTVYFDTPSFEMYHNHHNQRLNRYKIRVREYLSSGLSFLEIKFKNNRRETIKKRVPPGSSKEQILEDSNDFLLKNSPYHASDLKPSVENFFKRITLVHKVLPERITIDLELKYSSLNGSPNIDLPGISIIEVKRNRDAHRSDITDALQRHKIQPMGFSKYCIGTALTQETVKKNLFKPRIRDLGRYEKSFLITN